MGLKIVGWVDGDNFYLIFISSNGEHVESVMRWSVRGGLRCARRVHEPG